MKSDLPYDRPLTSNHSELNIEQRYIINFIGTNKKVLEIGCHTGYFSNSLKQNNCEVTGIEMNPNAIEKAAVFQSKSICGDIENKNIWAEIGNEKFDFILLMHVLEHLRNPEDVLLMCHDFLNENGCVVICLPNISNWNSRLNILRGNFDYTETGLMDKTHLRFFNYITANQLINNTEFKVLTYNGASKAYFKIVPHVSLLWRLNDSFNKHLIPYLKNPNLTDTSMCFIVQSKML